MCSSNPGGVVLPFGLKVPNPSPYVQFPGGISHVALDLHRAQQFCDYSSRLQYGVRGFPTQMGFAPYHPSSTADPYLHHYFYKDPRVRYVHEEPKPNHSYIGLIAMAILSSRDKKLVLSDIYQWILDNYPYFRTRGPGWRNSIRHNLSLNDCFIKSGRSANGKGHYWAIHPANIEDFQKGDFRRRRAQRRVRKHMGLSVPDDDDSPSPSPTSSTRPNWDADENIEVDDKAEDQIDDEAQSSSHSPSSESGSDGINCQHNPTQTVSKKRLFDMESLLAPDEKLVEKRFRDSHVYNEVHIRRFSSADVEDANNINCSSTDIGSTVDTLKCDEKFSPDGNVEGQQEKVNTETDPCVLQRQESLSVSETASKLWQNGLKQFGMPMMISHPSAFHSARSGYPWNALTSYLGAFPLLSVKNNLPSSLSLGRKITTLHNVQIDDTPVKTENDAETENVDDVPH